MGGGGAGGGGKCRQRPPPHAPSSSGSGGLCARVKKEPAREALALMPKPAVLEASAIGRRR